MKKVLILGGKGTGSVIANSIIDANRLGYEECEFSGFVNDFANEIEGFPVKGRFADVKRLIEEDYYFINTVYKIGGQEERIFLFENLRIPDNRLFTFVHPKSYVAPSVVLGPGCVVLANSSLSSMTKIGRASLVMNNVNIGHDNRIGSYCFFTASSSIGSSISIGNGCWFGLNCTVRGKVEIGERAVVGIGAVVTKNIGNDEIWIGNPARFHKTNSDEVSI